MPALTGETGGNPLIHFLLMFDFVIDLLNILNQLKLCWAHTSFSEPDNSLRITS